MSEPIIFILADDEQFHLIIKNSVETFLCDCIVETFKESDELLDHPNLTSCNLFIIDINLDKAESGLQVARQLCDGLMNEAATVLFISDDDKSLSDFDGLTCTFDFVQKDVDIRYFMNRIKVLLQVSKQYKKYIEQKHQIQLSLFDLFDYTNIFLIVLNDDGIIELCSYYLASSLGYEPKDLIGEKWIDYIVDEDLSLVESIRDLILSGDSETYRELSTSIKGKSGPIKAKWFHARIVNGISHSFCIGIPIKEISADDNIETIRAYYKDVIKQDNTTINAFRDILNRR